MSKKPVAQPQDKYVLRLPDGLRDRIKAYAERHGRSMNAEIVRVLEREYPEPWPLEYRVAELMRLADVVKGAASNEAVERLVHEIEETINGMVTGRVMGLSDAQRASIQTSLVDWEMERAKNWGDAPELDDDELRSFKFDGSTAKIVPPSEE